MLKIFSHQKSSIFFVLTQDAVQIRRFFFPLGNPPCTKKSKRDSLYFDLLPGPFTKHNSFFLLFVNVIKIKGKDNIMDMKFLFVFILLIEYNS